MHEGNFTEQIVNAILEELTKFPDQKPVSVKVKVGEMLHLVPDSVLMHFQVLTRGTRLEGARLDLVEVPVLVRCADCGTQGPVDDHHMLMCASCDSRKVEMVEGDGVVVEEIKL